MYPRTSGKIRGTRIIYNYINIGDILNILTNEIALEVKKKKKKKKKKKTKTCGIFQRLLYIIQPLGSNIV